jgi:hypothetical protein
MMRMQQTRGTTRVDTEMTDAQDDEALVDS